MPMLLANLIFLTLALTMFPHADQSDKRVCLRESVCIKTIRKEDTLYFSAENANAFDVTLTLNVRLENLISSESLPHVMTVPGKQTVPVLTLTKTNTSQAWQYHFGFAWTVGSANAEHDDSVVYAMPYSSGEAFEVIQGFHGTFSHQGEQAYSIDWDMPEGTEIHAARGGEVVDVKDDETRGGTSSEDKDYANYVRIRHDDGTIGEYDHLEPGGARVAIGDVVATGDLLGMSGNTGFSSRPHLHFWVYKAFDGYLRQSCPIVFKAREGTGITLEQGERYTAE